MYYDGYTCICIIPSSVKEVHLEVDMWMPTRMTSWNLVYVKAWQKWHAMGLIYDQKGESKNPKGMWKIQIHTHIH